jgi:excisionase family DNA binding protein
MDDKLEAAEENDRASYTGAASRQDPRLNEKDVSGRINSSATRGAGSVTPEMFTIAGFCTAFGIGRSATYEELKAGRLRAVKAGRRTLISLEAAREWAASLPTYPR